VGAGIGARLAATTQQALVASLLGALVAANTANDWQRVGHPTWMLVVGVVSSLLAALLATLLVRKAWPAPGK
jgi:phosphate/sulfate permease